MIGPRGHPAAPVERVMIEEAANHLTNIVRNDSAPCDLTVLSPNSAEPLSSSLRVAVWNCRGGLELKLNEIQLLFRLSNCDILVLNETFRRPGTRWPSYFPPLLGESTDHASSPTRCPAGVAIVANSRRIENIKSFSAVDHPASDGTKVCIKVNNVVILAVYIPPYSPNLLAEYVAQAHRLSSERESVIFCGDMNATHNLAGTHIDALTLPRGSSSFFRANTGPAFTRPSLSGQGGSVIDFIFGANADLTELRVAVMIPLTGLAIIARYPAPLSLRHPAMQIQQATFVSVWKTLKIRIPEHSTSQQSRR